VLEAAALALAFKAALIAPTHRPRVNRPWPIAIHAVDGRGRGVCARLTMRLLVAGVPVGKVDDGKVWRFCGTWREPEGEEIEFPPESRGHRLTFQALVTRRGRTVKLNYWVEPR
jgi:hypothetical protein